MIRPGESGSLLILRLAGLKLSSGSSLGLRAVGLDLVLTGQMDRFSGLYSNLSEGEVANLNMAVV